MKVVGGGSVVQRDKTKPRSRCRDWELSVVVESAGARKRRTRAFHGTWSDAQRALREFVAEVDGSAQPSGCTVAEYAASWHARRSRELAHNTERAERARVARIGGALGGVRLDELSVDAIEGFYDAMRDEGLAESTVNLTDMTLRTMLADAARDGLLASNPMDSVSKPRRGETGRAALSDEEMDALAARLDPSDGRELAVLLCLQCGLRRAEAVALEWRDVRDGCVHVERADAGDGTEKRPKTKAGVRTVPIPAKLADAMEGLRGAPGDKVCLTCYGEPFTAVSLGMWWWKHREGYGTDVSLHDLRHSYLTRLARAGVHPSVMQRLAGHSTMRVTLEIYTHVSVDMERDAVKRAFG